MTPEQIKSMSDLADQLSTAVEQVTEANVELESIELAIKGHRKQLDTLFDREREVRASRDQLVEAMEKAQAGLEAFEAAMPEDVPGINEESGLAELVGRMAEDAHDDEGTPASLPTEPGVMMQEASANLAEAAADIDPINDGLDQEPFASHETPGPDELVPVSDSADNTIEGYTEFADELAEKIKLGGAAEAMLNELDAADKVELDDVSEFVTVEELAAMSDDLEVADVETAAEVIDATNDIISDRANAIAQDAAGQFANSGKLSD